MSGYQPFATLRSIMVSGPPPMPVVDRTLVRPGSSASPRARQRGRFVTTRMVAEMRRRRAEGESLLAIAKRVGCCHYTVRKHTLDIAPPDGKWGHGGCTSKLDRDRAACLRRAGFTYREIGEEIGCSMSGAHKLLQGYRTGKPAAFMRTTHLVQLVAQVSGVACADLRAPLRGTAKKSTVAVNKARAILFWLARVRLPSETYNRIGRALGGFEGTTVADGFNRVQATIERLQLKARKQPGRYVRPLWHADWQDGRRHH